jgi:hypothetical protein
MGQIWHVFGPMTRSVVPQGLADNDNFCRSLKSFICGPKTSMTQTRSREQVNINVIKTTTSQQIFVDKFQNSFISCHNRGRKIAQRAQYLAAIAQMADGDFTNHEGMHQDLIRLQ